MEESLRRVNTRTHYVGDKICAKAKDIPQALTQFTPPLTYKPSDLPYQDAHTLHPPHLLPPLLLSQTTVRTDDHCNVIGREPLAKRQPRQNNPIRTDHHIPGNKKMISRLLRPPRAMNRTAIATGPRRWKRLQTPNITRSPPLPTKPKVPHP